MWHTFIALLVCVGGLSVSALSPLPRAFQDAGEMFGLNLHNNMPTESSLVQMMDAGIHWYRIDGFTWETMEPAPGVYDFSGYDKVIPRFFSHGLRVMTGIECTIPKFYNQDINDKATQVHLASLMGALAEKYNQYPVMWEFTNEPNLSSDAFKNNASGLADLAIQICQAIHSKSTTNTCVGPSLGFISRKFKDFLYLQEMFEAGVLKELDAVLVHPYRLDAPETTLNDFAILRKLVDEYAPLGQKRIRPQHFGLNGKVPIFHFPPFLGTFTTYSLDKYLNFSFFHF